MKHLRLLLLLIFALLFAQQGALAHGITHTLTESQQSLPHESPCELCAAYAQLGDAPLGVPPPLPNWAAHTEVTAASPLEFRSITVLAAAARAPPTSPLKSS
jgi:hypothetical protein